MSTQALVNCKIWLDSMDVSGDLNKVNLVAGARALDAATFGVDTMVKKPGLKTVKFGLGGFVNLGAGLSEEFLSGKISLADVPLTVGPTTGAEGEPSYSFLAALAELSPGAQVGEMYGFSASAEATNAELVRGTILHNAARSGTGTGAIFQLGAVSATQKLFAALHIPAISGGPTVTIKVQSAALVGFGSPTDRITFTAVTTVGSQWAIPILGAITDQFWRVTWTFAGGAGPSCTFIVAVGIQ